MLRYFIICIVLGVVSCRTVDRSRNFLERGKVISSVLRNAPRNANLMRFDYITPEDISSVLISNWTTIREEITPGFTCTGKVYGYYGDMNNECQVFHICLPLHQLYPKLYRENEIFHFSFICPKHTVFTQDAMVCAWTRDAVPCEYSEELYVLNEKFGKKNDPEEEEEETEEESAGNAVEESGDQLQGATVTITDDGRIVRVRN